MFFTPACRILAIMMLVWGASNILIGFGVAENWTGLSYKEGLARYLPNFTSSGKAIDAGLLKIAASIVVGTLAEMSFALNRKVS